MAQGVRPSPGARGAGTRGRSPAYTVEEHRGRSRAIRARLDRQTGGLPVTEREGTRIGKQTLTDVMRPKVRAKAS